MSRVPRARVVKVGSPPPIDLAAPPRRISLGLGAALVCGSGPGIVAAWLIFVAELALIFAVALPRIGHEERAVGYVASVGDELGLDDEGDAEREVAVNFVDRDGAGAHAKVRTTQWVREGATVEVLYSPSDRFDVSLDDWIGRVRVTGGISGLLAAIGLGLGIAALVRGHRAARLLRFGITTTATLVDKHVPDDANAMLAFTYVVNDQTYRHEIVTAAPSALLDDRAEPMVYDPRDPTRARLLDDLPGNPRIVGNRLVGRRPVGIFVGPALAAATGLALLALTLHIARA